MSLEEEIVGEGGGQERDGKNCHLWVNTNYCTFCLPPPLFLIKADSIINIYRQYFI